jgi:hypothetical protein
LVDIEAVREGEDSDEEIEGASSSFEFPAPTHDIVTADVFEDDVSQDEADLDVSSLALQNTMHSAQHVERWDSFLTRALNRGRNREIPLSRQERLPSGEDRLWEIGCAVSGPFDVNAVGFDPSYR